MALATAGSRYAATIEQPAVWPSTHAVLASTFATSSMTCTNCGGSSSAPPSERGSSIRNSPASCRASASGAGSRRSDSTRSAYFAIVAASARAVSSISASGSMWRLACSPIPADEASARALERIIEARHGLAGPSAVEIGARLPRAGGGEDGVLLPRPPEELHPHRQTVGGEAARHADGRQAGGVADGAEHVGEGAANGAPELDPQARAGGAAAG